MRFQPLESNPEVVNEYLNNIGLNSDYGMHLSNNHSD